MVSVQESGSTFKVFHLHSKYPHFNSANLVSVLFHTIVAVKDMVALFFGGTFDNFLRISQV